MDVNRKEEGKVDVARSETEIVRETFTQGPPSVSLSSEHFTFNESPDEEETVECINNTRNLFADFKKKPPTLEEALRSMEYEDVKAKELSKLFLDRANGKLEEFEAPGITPENVAAIFCYSFQCNEKNNCEGLESPYKKLNNSLSIGRNNGSLKKTRGFLFLLLQALRKLPRYTPAKGVLHRGIRAHVQTEADPNSPKTKPYATGNEKTWWAFTSTTEDLERTKAFIEKSEGTLFTISGKPWGYDISMFSYYPDEKEILIVPERRLKITSVDRKGNIIAVDAEMVKTPLMLEELIKMKAVRIKERKSKNKEDVPGNFRVENITESSVELSWEKPKKVEDEKIMSYQVSVRKAGGNFIRRNAEELLVTKGKETRLTAGNLEMGEEYELRVRCKFIDGWGSWGDKVRVVPFSWKECPEYVDEGMKYSVDAKKPKIATMSGIDGRCTAIGNMPLPLNKVTSWSIKVLKSKDNYGSIFIGVAPSDINQNVDVRGWYFDCYDSTLRSGPPHYYSNKEYGPRKGNREYVHTGDSVGVVMDTAKGELSFVLDGVNLGVAYEGIPLDKPFVPCVILLFKGDSVELVI